ncbi:hypothetical protein BLNAU_5368 [Blattamonas nauphoetae]|uniref:Uncharacterized protein n=1 Tax=Blattamonas nauphoetae TaxID=2049346 RepID=A0ABQ9Y744_9EUKA|nr:hypothetical protein BLNAU_5368 [Blattamonas nauphoetae]
MLASSPNRAVTASAMKMLQILTSKCSARKLLTLVRADLVPKLIVALNPLSLSFAGFNRIHTYFLASINFTISLANPYNLTELEIEDRDEQQAVRETVFQQVLAPSATYIHHLCEIRYFIVSGEQSKQFLVLIALILAICPYYQPTMDLVFRMPLFFTIPSCLTFIEANESIWLFFEQMICSQDEWNETGGSIRRSGTTMFRSLKVEGIEDVTEQRLQNEETEEHGQDIVDSSKCVSIFFGMNIAAPA